MAISIVQAVPANSSSAVTTLTLSGLTTTAGNLYAIALASGGPNVPSSVVDSAGNTWTLQVSIHPAAGAYIYTTTNSSPTSITSVTVNSTSAALAFIFYEISGANTTSPSDGSSVNAGSSATAISTGATGTPSTTTDLAISAVAISDFSNSSPDTGPTFTSGAGTNHFTQAVVGTSNLKISSSVLVLSSATAQTFTTTGPGGQLAYSAVILLIKPAVTVPVIGGTLSLLGVG